MPSSCSPIGSDCDRNYLIYGWTGTGSYSISLCALIALATLVFTRKGEGTMARLALNGLLVFKNEGIAARSVPKGVPQYRFQVFPLFILRVRAWIYRFFA